MPRFFRQAGVSDSDSESESDEELLTSGDEDDAPAKPVATASKPVMSRFLRKADNSSSSSSSSEDEDVDDSDASDIEVKKKPKRKIPISDTEDEESNEGVKRVPLRAMDKRIQQMEATGASMDNALKINDWVAISTGMSSRTVSLETF